MLPSLGSPHIRASSARHAQPPEAYAPIIGFAAYQVKFRTGRPALTWRELSTFIGLADSPHIHSRVLLTNCDELPAVLNDRQGFFCIRGSDLDRLEAGDFRAIEAWLADAAFVAPKKISA